MQTAEYRIVIDTNVMRAAAWSASGSSFRLLDALPHPKIQVLLSVPLYCEYQEILSAPAHRPPGATAADVQTFLRGFSTVCEHRDIHFLWRPWLPDPDDDMLLDLAVNGRATHLITFNVRDFSGIADAFGVKVVTPRQFLLELRTTP